MRFPWGRSVDEKAQAVIDSGDWSWKVTDGFENLRSGVGESRQREATVFCPGYQAPEAELSDLVDTNWLARRIVRALPEAAMQEKILFADANAQAAWNKINLVEGQEDSAFMLAQVYARTHGVSLLLLGASHSGDPADPLPPETPVEWLEPIRSEDFTVSGNDVCQEKNDPRRYGKPDYYTIVGRHRFRGQRIHYSRVLHFAGPAYTDPMHSRAELKMQGLSVLDPVYDVIARYSLSWSSIAAMIEQGSVPVYKLSGLIDGLVMDPKGVQKRLKAMNDQVSVMRAVLLDAGKNEDYKRDMVSFTDLPELLKNLCIEVGAASNIPLSEIFGRIVSGLGDVGEVEDRKWERRVQTYRTNALAPKIDRIMPGVKYQWQPIVIQTPKEKAELQKMYWDRGQITDEEDRKMTEEALNLAPLTPEQAAELEGRNAARPAVDPSLSGF